MPPDINITPTADMPPVTTTTVTQPSTSTSQKIETPEARQLREHEFASAQAEAEATQRKGLAQAAQTETEAQGKEATGDLYGQQATEAEAVRNRYLQRMERAQARADRAQAAFENFQFHNYWENKSTGDRLMARIANGFGGFASGAMGGPNDIADAMERDVQRDFDRQKLALLNTEKIAEWRAKGVTDLYGALKDELAALEIKNGLALKSTAEKMAAAKMRAGIPVDQATSDAAVQQIVQKGDAKSLNGLQFYAQNEERQGLKIQTQTTEAKGGGVEADKNAANFAVLKNHGERLANGMKDLSVDDVKAVRYVLDSEDFLQGGSALQNLVSAVATKVGIDPETGVSSKAKDYIDRARRAAEAFGRLQSGAAIGTVENKRFVNSLIPKLSDSAEDRAGRGARVLEDINTRGAYLGRAPRAGAGATAAPPAAGAAAAPAAPAATAPPPFTPAAPGAGQGAAAVADLRKRLAVTGKYITDKKDDPAFKAKVTEARKEVANLLKQLGAAPGGS